MLVNIDPEKLNKFYQDFNISKKEQTNYNNFINSNKRKQLEILNHIYISNAEKNNLLFNLCLCI